MKTTFNLEEIKEFIDKTPYYRRKYSNDGDTIDSFIKEFKKIRSHAENHLNSLIKLNELCISEGIRINTDDYNDALAKAKELNDKLTEQSDFIQECITDKQNSCEHELEELGHDSHYTFYRCIKCGKELNY